MNNTLQGLLIDLDNVSDTDVERFTLKEDLRLYTSRETRFGRVGELDTHDGCKVIFFDDRFEHSFFTSKDGHYSSLEKNSFSKDRAKRVRWIGPILRGEIEDVVWYNYPDYGRRDSDGRIRIKRLYVLWDENYIIWLEPRKDNDWKFSSAYTVPTSYIRRLVKRLVCKKISRD